MKFFLLFLLLFFSSCGIEVPQGIPRLNAPNGVSITHRGAAGIDIQWFGLNPEGEFSGYNIYYADNINAAIQNSGTKIDNIDGVTTNPTTNIAIPFITATQFTYNINSATHNELMQIYQNRNIYIYIRAYSIQRNLESLSSVPTEGVFNPTTP